MLKLIFASEQPPAGMFPPPTPIIHLPTGPASSPSTSSATSSSKPPNLIERFNLQSRLPSPKGKERATVPDDDDEREEKAEGKGKGKVGSNAAKWESSADQREASLRKRKEEMVLEARRFVFPLSPFAPSPPSWSTHPIHPSPTTELITTFPASEKSLST